MAVWKAKASKDKASIFALTGMRPCSSIASSVGFVFSKAPAPTNKIFLVLILILVLIEMVVPSSRGSKSYWTPSSLALVELVLSGERTSLSISSMTMMPLPSISSFTYYSISISAKKSSKYASYICFLTSFTFRFAICYVYFLSPLRYTKQGYSSSKPSSSCCTFSAYYGWLTVLGPIKHFKMWSCTFFLTIFDPFSKVIPSCWASSDCVFLNKSETIFVMSSPW